MQWEKRSVPFKVEVDVDNIVLNRVREQLTSVKGMISANLIHASRHFFSKNIYLEEALSWAEKAVTGKPIGQTAFNTYQNLAIGYEKLDLQEKADSVMNVALKNEHNLHRYVAYNKAMIKKGRIDRAVEILLMAKPQFGEVYAINNGLSYAYSTKGNYEEALKSAELALAEAPTEKAKSKVKKNILLLKNKKDINE